MSQVSGAFTVELSVDRLAEQIAVRVAALLGHDPDTSGRPDPETGGPVPDGVEGWPLGQRGSGQP